MKNLIVRIFFNGVAAFIISLSAYAQGIHYTSFDDWHTRCVEDASWPHGSAQPNRQEYALNENKSRSDAATETEAISMAQLNASGDDEDRFEEGTAVRLTGWVTDIKMGGVETCNCKAGPGP